MRRRVSLTEVFLRDGKYPIFLECGLRRTDAYVIGTIYFVYVHSHFTNVAPCESMAADLYIYKSVLTQVNN